MMTYEQFCEHCDQYQKLNETATKLYDLGMLRDDNPLDAALVAYAGAICDNFNADAGWFLNWIYDEVLNYRGCGEYEGHRVHISSRRDMYEFLQTEEAKLCWL